MIQIKTSDNLVLPGLLYEKPRSKKAAIFLHGNGSHSVFYHNKQRPKMAEQLNKIGVSFLIFNNRGAHYIKTLRRKTVKKRYGMAYEKIKDCIKDIDGAVDFLAKRGYKEFYLIGESSGANKICVYDFYKRKNKVSKYVLLGGGDDVGIYYSALEKKKFWDLLKTASSKIKQGKGEDIVKELLPDYIFSHQGFFDIANPDGDYNIFPFYEKMKNLKLSTKPLFRHFKSLAKPTLVVYGQKDEYSWNSVPRFVEILKKQRPDLTYKIISNADHSFSKHQPQLSKIMANWLKS